MAIGLSNYAQTVKKLQNEDPLFNHNLMCIWLTKEMCSGGKKRDVDTGTETPDPDRRDVDTDTETPDPDRGDVVVWSEKPTQNSRSIIPYDGPNAVMSPRDIHNLPKRFAQIFGMIISFAIRAGMSLISLIGRYSSIMIRWAPRLADAIKTNSARLFRLAVGRGGAGRNGQAGSREAMRKNFKEVAKQNGWKQCLRDGKPKNKIQ